MHPIVPLLICLTSSVAFPMLNLPPTIFSMCPGISEGQTFAIFLQHQPLTEWMIHQFLVLLVTEKRNIISMKIERIHMLQTRKPKKSKQCRKREIGGIERERERRE